jgi:ADP-ribose pyrophosphatase
VTAEIRCTATRVVYRNRWMTLREDEIVRGDGQAGVYSVVEKPDFAVVAALDASGLHLVEQYRYPVGGRYWEFPQGTADRPVEPLELARAELREETGVVAESMVHVARLFVAYGLANQGYDVWFATGLRHGEARLDPEEVGLVTRAFPVAEVEAMILDGTIRDGTTVAVFGLLRMRGLL